MQSNPSRKSLAHWNPDGNPEEGIDEAILQIKLAKEAKRWDVMVERINQHLLDTKDFRDQLKSK